MHFEVGAILTVGLAFLAQLVGFAFWLGKLTSQVSQLKADIAELKSVDIAELKTKLSTYMQIQVELALIKQAVDGMKMDMTEMKTWMGSGAYTPHKSTGMGLG